MRHPVLCKFNIEYLYAIRQNSTKIPRSIKGEEPRIVLARYVALFASEITELFNKTRAIFGKRIPSGS